MRLDNNPAETNSNPAAAFLTCALPENLQTTLPLPPLILRYDTALVYGSGLYDCGERGMGQNGMGRTGLCRLRLFWPTQGVPALDNPAVALVTEMPEFGGLSVTQGTEAIALEISRAYGLSPQHTVLIEHYDDRERGLAACLPGRINGEKFSCVTFGEMQALDTESPCYQVRRPQWRSLGKEEVELLLGSPLP